MGHFTVFCSICHTVIVDFSQLWYAALCSVIDTVYLVKLLLFVTVSVSINTIISALLCHWYFTWFWRFVAARVDSMTYMYWMTVEYMRECCFVAVVSM